MVSLCFQLCLARCLFFIVLVFVSASSAEQPLFIKGGLVTNADCQFYADVQIVDGKITNVGQDLEILEQSRIIDAHGLLVMPGGIDPHAHLEMEFMGQVSCDDFFTGQRAALAGGTTMHIDFVLPKDGDMLLGLKAYKKKAEISCMDYGFHMAITKWDEKVSEDMEKIVQEGINSFKFFMAYKGALMVSDDLILNGLERCKELGALPMFHCENGDAVYLGQQKVFNSGITEPVGHALSRPAVLEAEATNRAISLAEFINVPLYIVHVTSKEALNQIIIAKSRGRKVIGEPLITGLAMNGEKIKDKDFSTASRYVMSPPIRSDEDKAALQKAVAGGVLDLVATDHTVFNSTQKAVGRHDFRLIPNGVNGIEERLHALWEEMVNSGLINPMDFVRLTSTQAAKIFNIYPQKGVIAKDADADIILLDPHKKHTISVRSHHSQMDSNIYEGKEIRGKVVITISRGRVVWENEKLNVERGSGRYIPMKPFSYLFTNPVDTLKMEFEKKEKAKDEL